MKNWIKASTLAATVTLVTMVTPAVSAQELSCNLGCSVGEGVTAKYNPDTKTLSVSGKGTIDDYEWRQVREEYPADNIIIAGAPNSQIKLPENSNGLFSHVSGQINLPDNLDTISVVDMSSMFYRSKSENLNVAYWNTSNVKTMSNMFSRTAANPDVSKWDTSNVEDMSSMFDDATTANPDVSNWNTSKVTNMAGMFAYTLVANPDVSNWDVSNVERMDYMFSDSKKANPDVSKWNTKKVTSMTNMFSFAQVANPNVSNWDVSNVEHMDYMFEGAVKANPDVAKWNTNQVTTTEKMFSYSEAADPDIKNWKLATGANTKSMFCNARVATKWRDSEVGARPDTGRCMTELHGKISVSKQDYELSQGDQVTISATIDHPELYDFKWSVGNKDLTNETGPSITITLERFSTTVRYRAVPIDDSAIYSKWGEAIINAEKGNDLTVPPAGDPNKNDKNDSGKESGSSKTSVIVSVVLALLVILGIAGAAATTMMPK